MSEGKYLVAWQDEILFLKLLGSIRYDISAALEDFLDRYLEDDDFENIVVDLTGLEYIDSTNLGLLARIANFTLERHHRRTTLISTNENINQVLASVGFDAVFILIDRPKVCVDNYEEVPAAQDSEKRLACRMLEAHRTLMDLNEQNRGRFRNVVDVLEADQKKKGASPP